MMEIPWVMMNDFLAKNLGHFRHDWNYQKCSYQSRYASMQCKPYSSC